jgi:CAAX prenyl protease-like protein
MSGAGAGTPDSGARGALESVSAYVAPFAVLMAMLLVGNTLSLDPHYWYPVRTVAVAAALLWFSRSAIRLRPRRPWASVAVGVAVFVVWVAPDALWPAYREHWLFRNSLLGGVAGAGTAPSSSLAFLFFRVAGAAIVVPLAEELFWRGWLMRWLITPEFWRTPLGAYAANAFWITAVLFASEHGVYWDVGLAAGLIYNGWIIRTRSLADVILAHAVTNAALAAYVLRFGKWEYW